MNQDKNKENMGLGGLGQQDKQNQNKQPDRGNPSTTERMQPDQGVQRQDENKQDNQQTKF